MKQKFLIFAVIFVLIFVLIGLNAVSYVKKEKTPDSEANPNRSSYNTGATGTRAFFDLLAETGRTVTRWQESASELSINDKNQPSVFVIVGETRREFSEAEIEQIMRWVSNGGRLVLIDREPPIDFLKTTVNWSVSAEAAKDFPLLVDPSDIKQMTEKINAAKPVQPTVYTQKVNAVQPSRFASTISFEYFSNTVPKINAPSPMPTFSTSDETKRDAPPKEFAIEQETDTEEDFHESNSSSEKIKREGIATKIDNSSKKEPLNFPAPVAHIADKDKVLLADFPYGAGTVVFLSDPFVVSNGGISLVDNAQLAVNLVSTGNGIIAFDEFHQGFGKGQNRLFDYFAGTPLTAVLLQLAVLAFVIFYTQSRRFARPLPADEPNRLSKLEYVGAMAELQQRTRAFDLAMENIYKDFRRRVSRLAGVDALKTSPAELAALIADRTKSNRIELENILAQCEAIMQGEPTSKREMLALTTRLREIEETLGLQRRKRENKLN